MPLLRASVNHGARYPGARHELERRLIATKYNRMIVVSTHTETYCLSCPSVSRAASNEFPFCDSLVQVFFSNWPNPPQCRKQQQQQGREVLYTTPRVPIYTTKYEVTSKYHRMYPAVPRRMAIYLSIYPKKMSLRASSCSSGCICIRLRKRAPVSWNPIWRRRLTDHTSECGETGPGLPETNIGDPKKY